MQCKVCNASVQHVYSASFEHERFGRCCNYYECLSCGFCFTPSFETMTMEDWSLFYTYPEYFDQDDWAKLEWLGEGPGRIDILKNSLKYGETIMKRKAHKILIHGNGMSQSLDILNNDELYAGNVYATYSCTGHPHEIIRLDEIKNGEFDIVISAEVFEHFCHPIYEFDLMKKFICPGGCIVGTTGSKEKYAELIPDIPYSYLASKARNGHQALYSKESIQIISEKLGLLNYTQFASDEGHDARKWRIAFLKS
jgi:hypothetical protein